ncbi:MAG: PKD domain-containing protein [Ferruginibacter sp.]
MKLKQYMLLLCCSMLMLTACEKEDTGDTSFVATSVAPDNLALGFDITQDNTGKVTITPTGNGASKYEIYFGDATTTPATVQPGRSVEHIYAEGVYNVKLIAYGIGGQKTEFTQQLTVTFRVPENFEAETEIDPGNNYQLNVSATALYETNFRVTFGDAVNEVPRSFLEGETVNHVYAATGTYTVRIVAVSGGAATAVITRTITIVDPVVLPLTFESNTLNYNFSNFDGGVSTRIDNPQSSGINTSAKVVRMVKNAGQVWGGSVIPLSTAIDFSTNKIFRMKVFSPRVGAKVLLKVENATNSAISFEKEVSTTVANQWEDLIFDYTSINTANQYHNVVIIFELGIMGDGSPNFTFLYDDIRLVNSVPVALPLNFESTLINYGWTDFDGGNVTMIANPQSSGINTSTRVARMVKNAGQVWGGSFITLGSPIPFAASGNSFKMKVYSPRVGAKVLLKVENLTDGNINFEKEVSTTVANAWEELTFDYSTINTANSYQKIVLIFDLGTMGDGSPNYTFLFDDIKLN